MYFGIELMFYSWKGRVMFGYHGTKQGTIPNIRRLRIDHCHFLAVVL